MKMYVIDKSVRMGKRLSKKLERVLSSRTVIARILGLFIKEGKKNSGIKFLLRLEDDINIYNELERELNEQERYFLEDLEICVLLEEVILGITLKKVSGRVYRIPVYLPEVKRINLVVKWSFQILKLKMKDQGKFFFNLELNLKKFLENTEELLLKKIEHIEDVERNMTNYRLK